LSGARFFGVGVGPGDAELLTLKALRVIGDSPVIAVPVSARRGGGEGTVALEIIKKAVPDISDKEILRLSFPMTKDEAILTASRQRAAEEVAERLGRGQDVSFLTLGDPMLYSTFTFLMSLVTAIIPDVEVQVVPGITSVSASAAAAALPLVQAEEKLLIAPAFYSINDLEKWVAEFETVVLMKVKSKLSEIKAFVQRSGLEYNVSALFVERAGWEGVEIVKELKDVDDTFKAGYLSMVILKKGVSVF